MNTKNRTYQILDGPSREALLDAFKYAFDNRIKIPIFFTIPVDDIPEDQLENGGFMFRGVMARNYVITAIEHSDDGNYYHLRGYCESDDSIPLMEKMTSDTWDFEKVRFEADFSPQTRQGEIQFSSVDAA